MPDAVDVLTASPVEPVVRAGATAAPRVVPPPNDDLRIAHLLGLSDAELQQLCRTSVATSLARRPAHDDHVVDCRDVAGRDVDVDVDVHDADDAAHDGDGDDDDSVDITEPTDLLDPPELERSPASRAGDIARAWAAAPAAPDRDAVSSAPPRARALPLPAPAETAATTPAPAWLLPGSRRTWVAIGTLALVAIVAAALLWPGAGASATRLPAAKPSPGSPTTPAADPPAPAAAPTPAPAAAPAPAPAPAPVENVLAAPDEPTPAPTRRVPGNAPRTSTPRREAGDGTIDPFR